MPWEPLPDSVGEPTPIAGPLDAVMSRLVGSGGGGSASATEVIFDRWAELVGAGIAEKRIRVEEAGGARPVVREPLPPPRPSQNERLEVIFITPGT